MAKAIIPMPSKAVLAGRRRGAANAAQASVRIDWYIREVSDKVAMSMKQRIMLATALVKTETVKNISRPVTKGTGPRGGRLVRNRSKSGEFPKADTTQLLKSIFDDTRESGGAWEGFVGTTLDYGLILETRLNRSFLKRTLNEQRPRITRILTGPIA